MIIYIAVKMTGLPNKGKEYFNEVELQLKNKGHIVLNPASLPDGLHSASYMQICTSMIDACDAIYLLKNWRESKGAKLEKYYAEYQNKIIVQDYELEVHITCNTMK